MRPLQHQLLRIPEVIVSGRNHPVTGLEAVGHLVLLRVLAADGDGHTYGACLVLVQFVYPLAARGLVEIAAGDDEGILRLTEFDLHTEALAHTDIVGHVGSEDEVDVEHAVLYLGHHLGDLQWVALALVEDGGGQAGGDAVDVVLAERGVHLELVEHLDFGNACAGLYLLAGGGR